MKKLILLLCLITGLGSIYAQTPAYLDVKVMESLERQPVAMEYHLRVNPELEDELDLDRDYAAQRKMLRSRIKENENQLKQFLESNKVKYAINREETYAISRDEAPFVIFKIKVNNKTELDNLVTLLRQLSYVEGNVGDKIYPEVEKTELGLFEKLYTKARSKAEKMATLMNCSLGKILEVEDLNKQELNYYELLEDPSLSRHYDQTEAAKADPLSSITTLSMRFRFELLHK
ncbi:hypothetical protein [Haliscomenobacter hydrossis]|uniref:SIMPL domain-containing protein n=1 Tax=Haliscomenobacter hydrossis (strain ATCC 27775 / DSM 1100 / LMG 10767 / O) TaxID=760192 RepID=F4KVR7_HALH1|nr:hypothetical protein [Haliscomenobacter hydrossis]AEE52524.1 hypothetical protein Halhy_4689 [Haliscomenobacter hydrossis DSM 1100]